MTEDPFPERLKRLEDRIKAAKASRKEPERQKSEFGQSSLAWRMVTELVAGMGLGVSIGYGLDWMFGTLPVFLMVFALLGFAAGVRTMMRTAQEVRHGTGEGALSHPKPAKNDGGPEGQGRE